MSQEQDMKKREWPKVHWNPEGKRATFDCAGDVPIGWMDKPPKIKEPK